MATTETGSEILVEQEEQGLDMSLEEMKEEEQAMIQRQIESTNAQLETLEKMEMNGNPLAGVSMTAQELAAAGIHVTNIMEFSATIELSAPKDVSKMYNFSGVKSNLPRDDINLQFCRGVLKDRKTMLEDMKHSSVRRKSLLDPQTLLLLKSQEESNMFVVWSPNNAKKGQNHAITDMSQLSQFWLKVSDRSKFVTLDKQQEAMFGQSIRNVKKNYLNKMNHVREKGDGRRKIRTACTTHARDVANAYIDRIGRGKKTGKPSCLVRQTDKLVKCRSFWEGVADDIQAEKQPISTVLSEQIGTAKNIPKFKDLWESSKGIETRNKEDILSLVQDREER